MIGYPEFCCLYFTAVFQCYKKKYFLIFHSIISLLCVFFFIVKKIFQYENKIDCHPSCSPGNYLIDRTCPSIHFFDRTCPRIIFFDRTCQSINYFLSFARNTMLPVQIFFPLGKASLSSSSCNG